MLFSLYPTDADSVRAEVVTAVLDQDGDRLVFTSLHIPESRGLRTFGSYLQELHEREGLNFCADISPGTLELLGVGIDDLGSLRQWGVTMVRIDYGFTAEQAAGIAHAGGFRIAVNASTVDAALLDEYAGVDLVGWHNFYPRPETGLAEEFFAAQNRLLLDRGHEVYCFIPGELNFRAPLYLGLPTLESQRFRNAYVNHARALASCPQTTVVCAEGGLLPEHQRWIRHREQTGETILPLAAVDPSVEFMLEGPWRLRPEGTDVSHRIEGTREPRVPVRTVNADARYRGSLQLDLASAGRYHGELHLMRADRPLTQYQARVAEIASPYIGLVDCLRPGDTVRFERVATG